MVPVSGYWRGKRDDSTLFQCLNQKACLGGRIIDIGEINVFGLCNTGYTGNLCQSCADGYSSSSRNICLKCPDETQNVLILFSIIIGFIIVITVIVWLSLTEKTTNFSVFFKILVNFI